MTLNAGLSGRIDQEMAPNHTRIVIPALEVFNRSFPATYGLESESCRVLAQLASVGDDETVIGDFGLTFDYADNHRAYNVESGLRVVMRAKAWHLNQVVASKEELRDVTSIVVSEDEFAARMITFVAVHVKDEVVKDYKWLASFHLFIQLRWRVNNDFTVCWLWRLDVTEGVFVANAVNCLENDDQENEGKE